MGGIGDGPGGQVKGIIFNLLERAVVEEHGEDVWDDLLDAAGTDGVFSAVGKYDDATLVALVDAAAEHAGASRAQVLQWFGRVAIPMLVEAYPSFFEQAADLRVFLMSLNDVIHAEVRKLHPGAVVPTFEIDLEGDDVLAMTYRSPRTMCQLAIGFAEGAAAHFGEPVRIVERSCELEGDDACVLLVEPAA